MERCRADRRATNDVGATKNVPAEPKVSSVEVPDIGDLTLFLGKMLAIPRLRVP